MCDTKPMICAGLMLIVVGAFLASLGFYYTSSPSRETTIMFIVAFSFVVVLIGIMSLIMK